MTALIKIGNCMGVRIPKAIIQQAQLDDKKLKFKVTENGLLIQPVKKPGQNWKKEFDKFLQIKEMNQTDNEWLDAPLADNGDWEW